jgi:hypothetical protein
VALFEGHQRLFLLPPLVGEAEGKRDPPLGDPQIVPSLGYFYKLPDVAVEENGFLDGHHHFIFGSILGSEICLEHPAGNVPYCSRVSPTSLDLAFL